MISRFKLIAPAAAALITAPAAAPFAGAATVGVNNHSFESPVVDTTFLPVSLAVTGWNTSGPSADVDVDGPLGPEPARNSGTGIFPNPASGPTSFTNANINQLAYIFTSTGEEFHQTLPGGGGFQTIAGNNVYGLTVAVGNASTAPAPTDQLQISLFYTEPNQDPLDPTKRKFLATRSIRNNATDQLSGTVLKDFTAYTEAIMPGNPAAGRPINVLITTVGLGGSQFDFDDVRVNTVPEPASALLLLGGLPLALARRRRSSGAI